MIYKKAGNSILLLTFFTSLMISTPADSEPIPFTINYSLKYKSIESIEERMWPNVPVAVFLNPSDANFALDVLNINNGALTHGYAIQSAYLEQRTYRSRVVEPGIEILKEYKDMKFSMYAGMMKSSSGEYRNNTGLFCSNCTTKTKEFDIFKLSFRDTAYSYQGGFNKSLADEDRYGEEATVNLKGGEINAEVALDFYKSDGFSFFAGTGFYYTITNTNLSDYTSFTLVPRRSLLKRNIFYYAGDNLIDRSYWTRQIPLKVGFISEFDWIDVDTSIYYLFGDGRFLTHTRAPGLPVYQKSESRVKGDGWGFDVKLGKELSSGVKLGLNFLGKRYFAKGKDYLHGSYDFFFRAVQESYNLMDYVNTPLVYQGIREQGIGISLSYEY